MDFCEKRDVFTFHHSQERLSQERTALAQANFHAAAGKSTASPGPECRQAPTEGAHDSGEAARGRPRDGPSHSDLTSPSLSSGPSNAWPDGESLVPASERAPQPSGDPSEPAMRQCSGLAWAASLFLLAHCFGMAQGDATCFGLPNITLRGIAYTAPSNATAAKRTGAGGALWRSSRAVAPVGLSWGQLALSDPRSLQLVYAELLERPVNLKQVCEWAGRGSAAPRAPARALGRGPPAKRAGPCRAPS